ncbi:MULTISPECIES: hypothetical protein [Microbacterium]|nr:hypothetical protein [Microbacterium aurum]MBZ6372090.1 hypothetical protein [Microbacterium hominis]
MNIHDGARKHGIDDADIIHAATWPAWIEPLDDESPGRQRRLGFDMQG